jgi:hypothetical protein
VFATATTDEEGDFKSQDFPGFADGQVEAVTRKLRVGTHRICAHDASPPVHFFLPPSSG